MQKFLVGITGNNSKYIKYLQLNNAFLIDFKFYVQIIYRIVENKMLFCIFDFFHLYFDTTCIAFGTGSYNVNQVL